MQKQTPALKPMNIFLTPELRAKLQDIKKREGLAMRTVIVRVLEKALLDKEHQY